MKKHEYMKILHEFLPIELCEKIVSYIYTYTFKDREELRVAIQCYPNNKSIYGDCNYWDVSNVKNMEGVFNNSEFDGDISKWK